MFLTYRLTNKIYSLFIIIFFINFNIIANISQANSVVIDNNNRIIVAGFSSNGETTDFALARYTPDGLLDVTFNTNGSQPGVVITRVSDSNDAINCVVIDNNNKIVVAGFSSVSSQATNPLAGLGTNFAVARYNEDGSLDSTFNPEGLNPGIVITAIREFNDVANFLVIDNRNNIVVAGYSGDGLVTDFAVIRYRPDGSLDTTFNNNAPDANQLGERPGIIITSISANVDKANSVTIDSNNKIVVAGFSQNIIPAIAIVRYNPDGTLDSTLNPEGQIQGLEPGFADTLQDTFETVFPAPRPAATASTVLPGIVLTYVGGAAVANDVKIDNDNNIVIAGFAAGSSQTSILVARYLNNGSLDTTFNPDALFTGPGTALLDLRTGTGTPNILRDPFGMRPGIAITNIDIFFDVARSLLIDNNNKIVVTGFSNNGDNNRFATVRYSNNGSLDNSFGGNGIVITDIFTGPIVDGVINDNEAEFIVLDNNNRLVVTGFSSDGSENNFTTIRYNNNGTVDRTFNAAGDEPLRQINIIFDSTLTPGFFFNNQANTFREFHPGIVITHITYGLSGNNLPLYGVNDPLLNQALSMVPEAIIAVPILGESLTLPDTGPAQNNKKVLAINNNTPVIQGTAVPASVITLVINDTITLKTDVDDTGKWQIILPKLDDGNYTISGTNSFGNQVVPLAPMELAVDTKKPQEPAINVPAQNSVVQANKLIIAGTAEPGSLVSLYVNNKLRAKMRTNNAGVWDTSKQNLIFNDGRYNMYVISQDKAGNKSKMSNKILFSVDTKPPVVPKIVTPAPNSTVRINKQLVSGTAKPFVTVTIFANNKQIGVTAADAKGNWKINTELLDGTYILRAQTADPASISPVLSPEVTITVKVRTAQKQKNPTTSTRYIAGILPKVITGRAQPESKIKLFIDGKLQQTVQTNKRGIWYYRLADPSKLGGGTHTISVTSSA